MTAIAAPALKPGFADPVFASQASFRSVLDAMSYPGRIRTVSAAIDPPAPLDPALAALALTLLDFDTPVWLDAAAAPAAEWLRFHCGTPIHAEPGAARFALVADAAGLPGLDGFAIGEDRYPDRSATLLLQLPALSGGEPTRWTGPGIDGAVVVAPQGLPEGFWSLWSLNAQLYPLGVDVILVSGREIVGLPRTVTVEV